MIFLKAKLFIRLNPFILFWLLVDKEIIFYLISYVLFMMGDSKSQLKKTIISSSCGALITSLTMTPLDVVKIRLQGQTRMKHKGGCFVYKNGLMDHLCTCFNESESWYNRKIPGGR